MYGHHQCWFMSFDRYCLGQFPSSFSSLGFRIWTSLQSIERPLLFWMCSCAADLGSFWCSCRQRYIGETRRPLAQRIAEHQKDPTFMIASLVENLPGNGNLIAKFLEGVNCIPDRSIYHWCPAHYVCMLARAFRANFQGLTAVFPSLLYHGRWF